MFRFVERIGFIHKAFHLRIGSFQTIGKRPTSFLRSPNCIIRSQAPHEADFFRGGELVLWLASVVLGSGLDTPVGVLIQAIDLQRKAGHPLNDTQ